MTDTNESTVITRKRKKYKFARFKAYPNCFEMGEWAQADSARPLTLEVGAGSSLFSVELASRYPERQFVAMDVKADRLQRGATLALEKNLSNIVFLRAHASALPELFTPGSIEQIWLTFPDPQPKKRSVKHRLTHPAFLARYRQLLSDKGNLQFKTDNHALFDWSLEQLVMNGWQLQVLTYDLHALEGYEDAKILTTYEQKFLAEGMMTHYTAAVATN